MYVYFLKAREKLYTWILLAIFHFDINKQFLREVACNKQYIHHLGNMLEAPLAYDFSASRAAKEKIKKAK